MQVSRLFGNFAALRQISLRVAAGSSIVLLGENGAGKSTLLRLVAGLIQPTYGSIAVFGAPPREQLGRIAYMSHAPMLYDELTALENLRYFHGLCPAPELTPEAALQTVHLDPTLPRRVADYSQGMRQRTSLARVLMAGPDLLLLDEPFSNLDRASADSMVALLARYTATPGKDGQPRTLILTTHQFELAAPLARTTLRLAAGEATLETAA